MKMTVNESSHHKAHWFFADVRQIRKMYAYVNLHICKCEFLDYSAHMQNVMPIVFARLFYTFCEVTHQK